MQGLAEVLGEIPYEWLRKEAERLLTEEDKARIKGLGFEELMRTLAQRLAEQEKRHQGGSKMIGTAGTSPFGAYGYNPEGVRIGQDESRHRRAVKVWDERQFRNLADDVEVGTRNLKVALRKLRRFARTGAAEELDLDETIRGTARNAGLLDLHLRPERHNAVKVLMFLDVGGSMDDHVRSVEELFSAARSEFKHLEYFYFHNCLYEWVWRDNRRRFAERIPTLEVLRTYPPDYKVVFVGDATMSPYELVEVGGANEHWNDEPGVKWLARRARDLAPVGLAQPAAGGLVGGHQSIQIVRRLLEGPHVSADAGRARRRDQGAALALQSGSVAGSNGVEHAVGAPSLSRLGKRGRDAVPGRLNGRDVACFCVDLGGSDWAMYVPGEARMSGRPEQRSDDRLALGREIAGRHRLVSASVPVAGIAEIALDPVQVGMDPVVGRIALPLLGDRREQCPTRRARRATTPGVARTVLTVAWNSARLAVKVPRSMRVSLSSAPAVATDPCPPDGPRCPRSPSARSPRPVPWRGRRGRPGFRLGRRLSCGRGR